MYNCNCFVYSTVLMYVLYRNTDCPCASWYNSNLSYVTSRYYVAEGVRLYSQETWRLVTENRGVQLVEKHIQNVVRQMVISALCLRPKRGEILHGPRPSFPPSIYTTHNNITSNIECFQSWLLLGNSEEK